MRKAPGKNFAKIYDFITLPFSLEEAGNYDQGIIDSCQSLAKREVIRMKDFAEIAVNPFESDSLIHAIQRIYNIDFKEGDGEYV